MDPNLPRPYPWERQSGESPASFEVFQRYLAMGSARNISELGRQEGRDLGGLAHEHRWTARADAWARYVDEVRSEAVLDEVAEMARRHIRAANIGIEDLLDQLGKLRAKHSDSQRAEMRHQEIARALEVYTKVERLARGEPTDRVVQNMDVSRMTQEEVDQLAALLEKAGVK